MTVADEARLVGGREYGVLVDAARRIQDAVAGADAPDDVVRASAAHMLAAEALLEPYVLDGDAVPAGNRPDLVAHGHPGLVPFTIEHQSMDEVRGTVTFRRAHIGGGGAAHGGMLGLLFDDVLGWLAAHGRPRSRTAYLHIDYRQITPVGVELRVEGRIYRTEGRKLFASGRLLHGAGVLVEADALFVLLREGQP